LKQLLVREGFEVAVERDGVRGLDAALKDSPDCLVLDVMLPGKNGFDLLREIRAAGCQVPTLFLTARAEEVDRVLGLELGGDDYLVKPFSIRELVARVRALLRRGEKAGAEPKVTKAGPFQLDMASGWLSFGNGRSVELAHCEMQIMKRLMTSPGKIVPRDLLLKEIWGYETNITTRVVDFHVGNLRKKIETDPAHPRHILTAYRRGYRLAAK
jgi:DNA-binding response OmpR family regulator